MVFITFNDYKIGDIVTANRSTFLIVVISECGPFTFILHFAGLVLWHGRLSCHLRHPHCIWVLDHLLVAPFPIQIPTKVPRKAAKDEPCTWAPISMWENLMKILAPGFDFTQPVIMRDSVSPSHSMILQFR